MALDLEIAALSAPDSQEWYDFKTTLPIIAQYLTILGGDNFSGVNYGSVTPTVDNQDKPWLKLDSSGNPVSWNTWNGSEWAALPFVIPSGATAERPSNPSELEKFYDEDIEQELVYRNGKWRTSWGGKGQLIEVEADSLSLALSRYPGWIHHTASINRVIGGAGTGSSDHSYNESIGSDKMPINKENLPNITLSVNASIDVHDNYSSSNGPFVEGTPGDVSTGVHKQTFTTEALGSGTQLLVIQPTLYRWRLIKE